MPTQSVVLITGCSSGIGAALAREFHRLGHRVYATARRVESLADLAALGIHTLALDVTSSESVDAAAKALAHETNRLDILVNNAGYGLFGAVTDISGEQLRNQLNTNVVAPVQVSRAFLPLMIAQRSGRIVNIGSVSGIQTTPFAGAYCASKAALHALSEAMRLELAPFGIKVITIQPGAVRSKLGETATTHVALPEGSIFSPLAKTIHGRATASQNDAMPTDEFAQKVVTAILVDPAPIVFRVGPHSFRMPFLKRWMPTRMLDRKLSKMFRLDRLSSATPLPKP